MPPWSRSAPTGCNSPTPRPSRMMEEMGDKLDQHLLQAFRPVAFGHY